MRKSVKGAATHFWDPHVSTENLRFISYRLYRVRPLRHSASAGRNFRHPRMCKSARKRAAGAPELAVVDLIAWWTCAQACAVVGPRGESGLAGRVRRVRRSGVVVCPCRRGGLVAAHP